MSMSPGSPKGEGINLKKMVDISRPMTASPPASLTVKAHDHAVCVYRNEDELLDAFSHFLDEGLARGDLIVFVHPYETPEDALGLLEKRRPDARRLVAENAIALSRYRDAFERDGRIDHDHVSTVVGTLLEAAAAHGRSGVRIFVDASREYLSAQRADEWFAFESWLCPRLVAGLGLVCAYRQADIVDHDVIALVLKTHEYRFSAS